jgi:hypothetical protein
MQRIPIRGEKEVIIEKLELRLSKPYDESLTGGLVGYIDKLENSFLELTEYGIIKTEAEKYRLLKRNLFVEGVTDHLVMQMDEKHKSSSKRFIRVVKWLRAKVIQLDYHRGNHAQKELKKRRSARLTTTHDDEEMENFLATYNVVANMARGQSNDWIPSHIFGRLDQDVKDRILDIKDEIRREGQGQGRNQNDRSFGRQNDRNGRPSYDRNHNANTETPAAPRNPPAITGNAIAKDSLEGIPKQYGGLSVRITSVRTIFHR